MFFALQNVPHNTKGQDVLSLYFLLPQQNIQTKAILLNPLTLCFV